MAEAGNLRRFVGEGMLRKEEIESLSEGEKKVLNGLSGDEVACLIKVKKALKKAAPKKHEGPVAQFF